MKRLALLLRPPRKSLIGAAIVLSVFALDRCKANDNLTIVLWGTTAEAAPCQFATLSLAAAAAVAAGAPTWTAGCTVNLYDTSNTKIAELKNVFRQYCNTKLNLACTDAQVLQQIPRFFSDAIQAEALRYNTNNATIAQPVPVQ